jgi:hypothetical protein
LKEDIEEYPGLSGLFHRGRGWTAGDKCRDNTDVGKVVCNQTSAAQKW